MKTVVFWFSALSFLAVAAADDPRATPGAPGVRVQARWARGVPFVFEAAFDRPDDRGAMARAVGDDPELLGRVFTVHTAPVGGAISAGQPGVLGSCRFEGGVASFRSRFPAERGMRYEARLDLGVVPGFAGRGEVSASFEVPGDDRNAAPTTVVSRVAPSADTLPENLLKFYLEFSAPMSRGEAYEHVRLLDLGAGGKPVERPFLELGEELWDPRGVRFTLRFDPGRVKTGLKPREDLGPVLVAGKSYALVVDRGWHDAEGRPLKAEFRKTFRAGPADVTPPDPNIWKVEPPRSGTRAPLVVRFPEPLDRAMLQRVVGVTDPTGRPVTGTRAVADDERSWLFTPDRTWTPGRYSLLVDRELEDLAGNSIGRPFEVDLFEKVDQSATPETVTVPFTILSERRE
jgi:hypothetical protein